MKPWRLTVQLPKGRKTALSFILIPQMLIALFSISISILSGQAAFYLIILGVIVGVCTAIGTILLVRGDDNDASIDIE
jgi:hypothetical protein